MRKHVLQLQDFMLFTARPMKDCYPNTTLLIGLSLLISCGGPEVIVNEGEFTKKLPETTRAVERMQPVVDKIETEQKKEVLAAQLHSQAGFVPSLTKERPLKILSSRSNFLTLAELSDGSDEDICKLKSLTLYEELIDSQKIISLAKTFSRCSKPQPMEIIETGPDQTEIIVNLPTFWTSTRMELDDRLRIKTFGKDFTVITELFSLNTTISTRAHPKAQRLIAGRLRIASMKTWAGPNAVLDALSPEVPGPAFESMPADVQQRMAQRSFEDESNFGLDNINIDEPAPPHSANQMQAALIRQSIPKAIALVQATPSLIPMERDYRIKDIQKWAGFANGLEGRNPSIKAFIGGKSELSLGTRYNGRGEFKASFELKRSRKAPLSGSILTIHPLLLQLTDDNQLNGSGLHLISLGALNRKIKVFGDHESIGVSEFSPFLASQGIKTRIITKAVMTMSIQLHIPDSPQTQKEVRSMLPQPESLVVDETWEVTLEGKSAKTSESLVLTSTPDEMEESNPIHSIDEMLFAIKNWNLPEQVRMSPVLQRFKTLEQGEYSIIKN